MFHVWSPRPSIAVAPLADFTPSRNTQVNAVYVGISRFEVGFWSSTLEQWLGMGTVARRPCQSFHLCTVRRRSAAPSCAPTSLPVHKIRQGGEGYNGSGYSPKTSCRTKSGLQRHVRQNPKSLQIWQNPAKSVKIRRLPAKSGCTRLGCTLARPTERPLLTRHNFDLLCKQPLDISPPPVACALLHSLHLPVGTVSRASGTLSLPKDESGACPRGSKDRKKSILAQTLEKPSPTHEKTFSFVTFILGLNFSFSIENFNPRSCFFCDQSRGA